MKTTRASNYQQRTPVKRSVVKRGQNRVARAAIRQTYPIHKRFCLHPLTLFVFLCAGVFMGGWTYKALAETVITATIQAPPLQAAATITAPDPDSVITTAPTTVTGTCPDNSYVKLSVNGSFRGAAWCEADNTFSIITTLFSGKNILVAQDYNTTDTPGPASAPITLTYAPPIVVGGGGSTGGTSQLPTYISSDYVATTTSSQKLAPSPATVGATGVASNPLVLDSDFEFYTFKEGQSFDWTMSLEGGTPPYNVYIDWNDGEKSELYFPEDPTFTIHHKYKTPGNYAVVVHSVDSSGSNKLMQLAALITDKTGVAPFLQTLHSDSGSTASIPGAGDSATAASTGTHRKFPLLRHVGRNTSWLLVAWPSYVIVVLMAASFWLGERREIEQVTAAKRPRPARKPRPRHA